jgi:hypothetical protein
MTNEMSDATRLVRQTLERLIEEFPGATDAQLLILLARAARADDELKDAAVEWTSRDLIRTLKARVRRPLRKSR